MRSSIQAVREAFDAKIKALGYQTYPNGTQADLYPHVLIGECTESQNGAMDAFGQTATITVIVVDGWERLGDRSRGDGIVNAITSAVLRKPRIMDVVGFDMPSLVLDNVMTATEQTKTHTLSKTAVRFKMQLFQESEMAITADTEAITADTILIFADNG
jgi:hypothetical protein